MFPSAWRRIHKVCGSHEGKTCKIIIILEAVVEAFKSLQGRGKTGQGVQPLQRSDGTWARSSSDKAELLADTFLSKSLLPSESLNEFSPLPPACTAADTFVPVRTRDVKKVLRKLREDSATGPDSVATQALKKCCDSLARPIALVIR